MSLPSTGKAVHSHLEAFLDHGNELQGVVHVGANDGAEVHWYLEKGLHPILCFEPHPAAVARAAEEFKGQPVAYIQAALGEEEGSLAFLLPADGDDEKFSRYKPVETPGHPWTSVPTGEAIVVPVLRFDEWMIRNRYVIRLSAFNTLVIDAQGMEMEVLRGFGLYLNYFEFLCIELSKQPVYDGEVPAEDVVRYLTQQGYLLASDIHEHDDVLFTRL